MVTGDSQEEVMIFRDKQTLNHNIYISIIIIISTITSIIAIIINSTKDDILDMEELFHTLTNF